MATTVKVLTIGSSTGIVLPKEMLARLRIEKGDTLYISETPRGIELTPYDADFAEQIAVGRRIMRKNRDVLRELAK